MIAASNIDKIYLNRGITRFKQNNFSGAEVDLKKALDKNNSIAVFWLAKTFAEQQKPALALEYLKKYLSNGSVPNPNKIFKDESFKKIYGSIEWQQFISNFEPNEIQSAIINAEQNCTRQNYKPAHQQIDNALAKYPASSLLHSAKAEIYEQEGNFTLARFEMKKASDIEPLNVSYLSKVGDYSFMLNDFQSANNNYLKVYELSPEEFDILLKIARTSLKNKQFSDSKQMALDYLKYFPEDTSAIFLKAQADYGLKEYTGVLKSVNVLIEKNGPRAEWYLLRGMAYFETSTYKYASYDLSMSLDLSPNNTDANYFLGNCEYQQGNNSLACYYWQRALKLGDSRAFDKIARNCGQ
jgi:Tfp pilus assembly protein PilF